MSSYHVYTRSIGYENVTDGSFFAFFPSTHLALSAGIFHFFISRHFFGLSLMARLKIEWYLNDLFKLLRPNETFFSSYLLFNSGYLVVTSGYLNATTSYCSYL